eukprot:XP_001705277.1 Hypothetical protein GL50803_31407 [Giardia lamblia ATCC 50803]
MKMDDAHETREGTNSNYGEVLPRCLLGGDARPLDEDRRSLVRKRNGGVYYPPLLRTHMNTEVGITETIIPMPVFIIRLASLSFSSLEKGQVGCRVQRTPTQDWHGKFHATLSARLPYDVQDSCNIALHGAALVVAVSTRDPDELDSRGESEDHQSQSVVDAAIGVQPDVLCDSHLFTSYLNPLFLSLIGQLFLFFNPNPPLAYSC